MKYGTISVLFALIVSLTADAALPPSLSGADVVVVAEALDTKCGDGRFSITEVWKASKPIRASEFLPSSAGRLGSKILLLVKVPITNNLGGNSSLVMSIRELPIVDDSVTVETNGVPSRYKLADLRIALTLAELRQ